jgi:hypothetical protein
MTRAECGIIERQVADDIRILREYKSELQGKASQSSMNVTITISVFSLILAAASFLVMVLQRGGV